MIPLLADYLMMTCRKADKNKFWQAHLLDSAHLDYWKRQAQRVLENKGKDELWALNVQCTFLKVDDK